MAIAIIVLVASLSFGSFVAYSGAAQVRENRTKRRTWVVIEGEVTGYEESSRRDQRGLHVRWAPMYRYYLEGTERTATSQLASSSRSYQIGERIRLFVDPGSGEAVVASESGDWLFSWGFVIAGTVWIAVAVLVFKLVLSGFLS
jgi:hypothetical protein